MKLKNYLQSCDIPQWNGVTEEITITLGYFGKIIKIKYVNTTGKETFKVIHEMR